MVKRIVLMISTVLIIGAAGCVRHVPPPKPAPLPPPPTLGEQLDNLYKNDHDEWRYQMTRLMSSESNEIPDKHLVYAMEEFNTNETRKECIDASYLYLKKRVQESGKLTGNDRQLFIEIVEYALKSSTPHAMNRVEALCRLMPEDEICQRIR